MARTSRLKKAYLKHRRTAIDEIRMREMARDGHKRAAGMGVVVVDIYGFVPSDLTSDYANVRRKWLHLYPSMVKSSREEILSKINRVADFAEIVFRLGDKALFLLRDGDYFYFLYRERGVFYKKSILYRSRTHAMDRFQQETIIWDRLYTESVPTVGDPS